MGTMKTGTNIGRLDRKNNEIVVGDLVKFGASKDFSRLYSVNKYGGLSLIWASPEDLKVPTMLAPRDWDAKKFEVYSGTKDDFIEEMEGGYTDEIAEALDAPVEVNFSAEVESEDEVKEEDPKTEETKEPEKIYVEVPVIKPTLEPFSDEELVAELRRRGVLVQAEKYIRVEL